jgi:hypothetical protein
MTPLQSDALAMLALFICIAVLAIISHHTTQSTTRKETTP